MSDLAIVGIALLIVILPAIILSAVDGFFPGSLPLRQDRYGSIRPYAPPPRDPSLPYKPPIRPQR